MSIKLDTIRPNDRNPRTIGRDQFEKLCASIKRDPEFMRLRPIVVDRDGVILGGNQRYRACVALGMDDIPDSWVVRAVDLTPEQRKRFVVLDNAPEGMAGEWDWDILGADWDITELEELGIDVSDLTDPATKSDADPQVDRAAELAVEWGVKPGDLWALGEHRLLCGDSTKADDVARVMGGAKSDLCFTSPPYNAGKYTLTGNVVKRDKTSRYGQGVSDNLPEDQYVSFLCAVTDRAMESCRVVAVNIQQLANNKFAVLQWVGKYAEHFVDRAVWYKGHGNPAMAERVMASRFEDIWIFSPNSRPTRAIETADFRGTVENVVEMTGASAENVAAESHAATMPIGVCLYAVRSWTVLNATVYDPFSGSGTTIIACEQLGRKCRAIEIIPGYVAVALQRYKDATGKAAEIVSRA